MPRASASICSDSTRDRRLASGWTVGDHRERWQDARRSRRARWERRMDRRAHAAHGRMGRRLVMTMNLAPELAITSRHAAHATPTLPLVVEFTSSRVRQRPLAARPGGIELAERPAAGAGCRHRRAPGPAAALPDQPAADVRRAARLGGAGAVRRAAFAPRAGGGDPARAGPDDGDGGRAAAGPRVVERFQHAALGFTSR